MVKNKCLVLLCTMILTGCMYAFHSGPTPKVKSMDLISGYTALLVENKKTIVFIGEENDYAIPYEGVKVRNDSTGKYWTNAELLIFLDKEFDVKKIIPLSYEGSAEFSFYFVEDSVVGAGDMYASYAIDTADDERLINNHLSKCLIFSHQCLFQINMLELKKYPKGKLNYNSPIINFVVPYKVKIFIYAQ